MKIPKGRSVEKIVEEQIQQWQRSRTAAAKKEEPEKASVISISRQPGSRGNEIAAKIAEAFGYDLFDKEIIKLMAENTRISSKVLETLDEKGLSMIEDVIATIVEERHLWPDQYIKQLMKIIGTIGRHRKAVIVGRGATFIIPAEENIRLRFIASLENRIKRVAGELNITREEARCRIYDIEARRRSFTRRYFYAGIDDPANYDLVINTDYISDQQAVALVSSLAETGFKPLKKAGV
ncbi:MAG: cytidylate kinase-like family protein [Desulfobacteraceae bacterium]|nr:cytidylate kinase-like family protein [Desulfobacteraceae bacterium]